MSLIINTQLATPPSSQAASPKISNQDKSLLYKSLSISFVQSDLMPNPSKIKENGPFKWSELKNIVNNNQLELLARSKNETQRYLDFKTWLKLENLNIQNYIIKYELNWQDAVSDAKLFTRSDDVKILLNKFPYYFEDDVTHFCIWTKVQIPNDPDSQIGDLSKHTRLIIDKYVRKTFPNNQLLWFRNWANLQSVKLISHIHVLVKGLDDETLHNLLGSSGNLLTNEDYLELETEETS